MKILKFGGSSLATPGTIRDVGRILLDARRREPVIAVVSAFQGVTNQLIECARLAERADAFLRRAFDEIAKRHRSRRVASDRGQVPSCAVRGVDGRGRRRTARVRGEVDALLAELRSTLQGIHLLRHCPPRALDMTASFGERLSALIVAAYLDRFASGRVRRRARVSRHRRPIHACERAVSPRRTGALARAISRRCSGRAAQAIPIVTGFIGATADGQTTTIGRNGSDYSAAIVGAAVGASVIEIWTDVDGVLSADPARRAGRVRAAADDLRRGDGAVVLRRQGAALGDDRAGGREADPDPDQEHVQPRRAGHADLAGAPWTTGTLAKGITVGRRSRAADAARPGHGRRAGHRRPAVPRRSRRRGSTSS